jgi:hypothetical protein
MQTKIARKEFQLLLCEINAKWYLKCETVSFEVQLTELD